MSVDDRLADLEPLARVILSLQTDLAAVTEDRDRWKAIANRYTSGLDLVVGCEACPPCAHVVAQVLDLPPALQRPPEGLDE